MRSLYKYKSKEYGRAISSIEETTPINKEFKAM